MERGLNWSTLLEQSLVHGVWPLVYLTLQAHFARWVPKETLEELAQRFAANSRHNVALSWELVRILEHLRARDVRAVPFKGPALAVSAYGNLLARVFFDLDIAIRRTDLRRAREGLVELGYLPRTAMSQAQEARHLKQSHEYGLLSGDRKIAVELHWLFSPRHWPVRLRPEQLWDRTESISLVGNQVPSFAPEDLAVILAAHGSKHQWARLDWLAGLAELVRSHPQLDWDAVQGLARDLGLQRVLGLSLSLAQTWLGAPVPEELQGMFSRDVAVRRLAERTTLRWLDTELAPGEWDSYALSARERWRDRIPSFLHTLRSKSAAPGRSPERRAGRGVSASMRLLRCLFGG